ncbi:MAG TPA: hypothetical protein P5048_02280 [Chlamydiales bacterium]|nr:hypothetical protein [Chlamydiales bacterium]
MKTHRHRGARLPFDFDVPEFSKKETIALNAITGSIALGAIALIAKAISFFK